MYDTLPLSSLLVYVLESNFYENNNLNLALGTPKARFLKSTQPLDNRFFYHFVFFTLIFCPDPRFLLELGSNFSSSSSEPMSLDNSQNSFEPRRKSP